MGAGRGILLFFFLSLNRACQGPQQPLSVTGYPLYSSVKREMKRVPRNTFLDVCYEGLLYFQDTSL